VTALAAQADVETELGRTLTTAEEANLESALAAASRSVRRVTGRRYEAGTFTVRRRVQDCKVALDSPSSVDTVEWVGFDGTTTELTGWNLRGDIVYGIRGYRWVDVTYTVDTPVEIPADVVSICAAMAGRRLTNTRPEGARSWTVTRGPFTESQTDGPTDSIAPTVEESQTLALYAMPRFGPLASL
jgi:hypothetical protein